MSIVLQKYIADAGHCSRRQAQALIEAGQVTVNDKLAELGMRVEVGDQVKIDGKPLGLAKSKIYIILNKPVGYACTHAKVEGEKNVYELVPLKDKLFVVGRLDKNSRGLIILTNDGELTQRLTHPKFEHRKQYIVKVNPPKDKIKADDFRFIDREADIISERLMRGIDIGEGDGVVRAKLAKYLGNNQFEIILTYGKKRQIRRMFRELGCNVVDLLRTEIAGQRMGVLAEGAWREMTEAEITRLKNLK
ncbi:rRNA pseudouridine synthase [Candidatus Falkowbacteria bacterium]|nr:rRNA pseudouridine synthase [Candidatus Falkowbacteria bacterium]